METFLQKNSTAFKYVRKLNHRIIFKDKFPVSGDTYSDPHSPTLLENEDLLAVKR